MKDNNELKGLLKLSQDGDAIATDELIKYIRDHIMRRRIGRYLSKNRQVENDDLIQEFLIGVALNMGKADLDIGDPIEYICQQGVFRVRSYLRKHIIQGTSQICEDCGYETRLNRVGTQYVCKRCGGTHVQTRELNDYDEVTLMNIENAEEFDADVVSNMMVSKFESTLDKGTNVYILYKDLVNGINRDETTNYIKEIAIKWGCSQNNVVQNMDKLKSKLNKFAKDNGMVIVQGQFVSLDE